jgi:hypothetical protein
VYLLCTKNKANKPYNNIGILGNIVGHYGSYELASNGSMYIHTFFWLANALDPNKLVLKLQDDKAFHDSMI